LQVKDRILRDGSNLSDEELAVRSWQELHERGYFQRHRLHRDWRVYNAMPQWFMDLAKPTPEDDALEIGCGYGQWMIPLAPLVDSVTGIDIHEAPLAKARELFRARRLSTAKVFLCDGLSTGFSPRTFSLVYSISVMQHIPREIVRRYISEAAHLLIPGGRGLFHFRLADGRPGYVHDIDVSLIKEQSVGWTKEEIVKLAERAGIPSTVTKIDPQSAILVLKAPIDAPTAPCDAFDRRAKDGQGNGTGSQGDQSGDGAHR